MKSDRVELLQKLSLLISKGAVANQAPALASTRWKLLVLMALYILQGIPVYFFTMGLPTILRKEGQHLQMIGLLGMLGLPWALKFLWAPFVDRFYFPRLGKRKSWIWPLQLVVALLFLLMSQFPLTAAGPLTPILLLGSLIILSSSTQDIAIDALAVEMLTPKEKGWGSAMQGVGASLGGILGGSLVLYLYEQQGWEQAILILAFLTILPFLLLIFLDEKALQAHNPAHDLHPLPQKSFPRPSLWGFFRRPESKWILLMCFSFRLSEGLFMGLQAPFLVDMQLSPSSIGLIIGVIGGPLGLAMALLTGYILRRSTPLRVLNTLAGLKILCYLGTYLATSLLTEAQLAQERMGLAVFFVLFHLCLRYALMVALGAFFMRQCSLHQVGTDFAIMGCCEFLFYIIAVSASGWSATHLGLAGHFLLVTILAALAWPAFSLIQKKLAVLIAPNAHD